MQYFTCYDPLKFSDVVLFQFLYSCSFCILVNWHGMHTCQLFQTYRHDISVNKGNFFSHTMAGKYSPPPLYEGAGSRMVENEFQISPTSLRHKASCGETLTDI